MRRELPNHPHIDHLKKQAKDLLDAHKRGDAEALERIVASLPAFAGLAAAEAARAPFALHDAQSAIAREYGFASWNDLRLEVERRASEALPSSFIRSLAGRPLPAEVTTALSEAWSIRDDAPDVFRQELPLVAFRDALLTPGAVAPIAVGRASSLAAVDAALVHDPRLLAVFSQREPETEDLSVDRLYPVGCVAVVREKVQTAAVTFIVVQGLRWASIEAIEAARTGAFVQVRVAPFPLIEGPPDDPERDALVGTLRDRAHRLASGMPQPDRAIALIDSIRSADRLSDLIVANLPCPLADKARYAAEPLLPRRLQLAIALCEGQLAAAAG